ncbi:hypothetical protein Acsp07_30860 [Actinomycetospora sp. NBRC 106378]|nr:hypothetical protein Acsp07_30860 [Actinomycetospora sp. NBRC 106378]
MRAAAPRRCVVDAPAVDIGTDPGRVHDLADLADLADLVGELGEPGAGWSTSKELGREPVEVVDGARRGMAVTAVALTYQCALITRLARGRCTAVPSECQAVV